MQQSQVNQLTSPEALHLGTADIPGAGAFLIFSYSLRKRLTAVADEIDATDAIFLLLLHLALLGSSWGTFAEPNSSPGLSHALHARRGG